MYDNFKLLNYSNSLVSPELYARHLSRLFSGNVVDGLLVVPKTGLTVTLQSGNGFIPYGSGATASAREFSLVADFDITLDTADASNPRIDLIVIYVDMAVSLPGGTPTVANLDGPGVVKATFVKGTPNSSPVDPTVGAIQTKVGASNPYIIVAAVRVDATVTTIAANKITDSRVMARLSASNIADSSLTNAKMNYTDLHTKVTISAGSGFTEFAGDSSASFYVKNGNRVEFMIGVQKNSGNIATSDVFATVPAAIRPANAEFFTGSGAGALHALVAIRSNGNVDVSSVTGAGNILFVRGFYYV